MCHTVKGRNFFIFLYDNNVLFIRTELLFCCKLDLLSSCILWSTVTCDQENVIHADKRVWFYASIMVSWITY